MRLSLSVNLAEAGARYIAILPNLKKQGVSADQVRLIRFKCFQAVLKEITDGPWSLELPVNGCWAGSFGVRTFQVKPYLFSLVREALKP